MNFIEKLFKQNPFIYYIGGKYYAFGVGVCSECEMSSVLLESRYINFIQSLDAELTREDAWRIFHKLMFEAEAIRNKKGFCGHPEKELLKFSFSSDEIEELKTQSERCVNYWKRYNLNNYPN